nr:response regulator [Anaerolineae bacterium]
MTSILIVDDEELILDLLHALLSNAGYTVYSALDGAQALAAARKHQPDLILLDVKLPNMSGIEVCQQLRADDRTGHIPVVLTTGYEPAASRVDALWAGAVDYVSKPFDGPDLLQRLKTILAHGDTFIDQSQRLLHEMVHASLAIFPSDMAWMLAVDPRRRALVSQAIASSRGQAAHQAFEESLHRSDEKTIPLSESGSLLARTVLAGTAIFNRALSELRSTDREIYNACLNLDIFFFSLIPLQMSGMVLGLLMIGSRDPVDTETARGQQVFAAVASQAATTVYNVRLMNRLAEREAERDRERLFRQAILDTMGEGLLAYDPDGQITYVNNRLCLMSGYSESALKQLSIQALLVNEDGDPFTHLLESKMQMGTMSLEAQLNRADGRNLPVLAVHTTYRMDESSEDTLRLLGLTDLSFQKAREKALKNQTDRLHALNEAARIVASLVSFEETIDTILSRTAAVLGVRIAAIFLKTPDQHRLVCSGIIGNDLPPDVDSLVMDADQGMQGFVLSQGHPVISDFVADDPRFNGAPLIPGVDIRAVAIAPLVIDDEPSGLILAADKMAEGFNQEDAETLLGLANIASMSLNNARMHEEAQRHIRDLTLLLKTSEVASSTLLSDQVLTTVVQQLMDTLKASWCRITTLSHETGSLVSVAQAWNMFPPEESRVALPLKQFPAIAEAVQKSQHIIRDAHSPSVPAGSVQLILPLLIEDRVMGVAELSVLQGSLALSDEDVNYIVRASMKWAESVDSGSWQMELNLRRLGERLCHTTRAPVYAIYALDQTNRTISCIAKEGVVVWPVSQGPQAEVQEGSLHHVSLAERTPVTASPGDDRLDWSGAAGFEMLVRGPLLITPLVARAEAIGMVELIGIDPAGRFTPEDLSLAQAIGNVVGNALENARLYSTMLRRAAQLEAAYRDLKEADQLKAEWIQNVSHELRTPLTSLIGYIDLMADGDLGPLTEDQQEGIQVMSNQSRQLSRIVEDILLIQAAEHRPMNRSMADLPGIAVAAIAMVKEEIRQNGLQLKTYFDPNLPSLYIDVQQIRQAFSCLLSNAIKFSPSGGIVTVVVEDNGSTIKASVSDQGIGIPAEEHERIWRRFYQIDGSMTRQYGGTGLGLAIARQVISNHSGRIWVESKVGKGSTFSFVLPKENPARAVES